MIAAVAIGLAFGYFGRAMFDLHAKTEVDLVDFYKVLLGVIAALYIGEAVRSRTGDRRREKDIIIEKIDEVLTAYRFIDEDFQAAVGKSAVEQSDRTALAKRFKLASAQLTTIQRVLPRCRPSKRCGHDIEEIRKREFAYKRFVTDVGRSFPAGAFMKGAALHRELEEGLLVFKIDVNVMP
jgi:hypothetical protein